MPQDSTGFKVTDQIGHILRRANQRHTAIFAEGMPEGITPTRFAAMSMLKERGPLSQNKLGRLIAMDVATIKGVVDRLKDRGWVTVMPDPKDGRRNTITLSDTGLSVLEEAIPQGRDITAKTLEPLSEKEQAQLISVLRKIAP